VLEKSTLSVRSVCLNPARYGQESYSTLQINVVSFDFRAGHYVKLLLSHESQLRYVTLVHRVLTGDTGGRKIDPSSTTQKMSIIMGIPMILEMFNSHGQPLDRHPVGSFVKYSTKLPTGCRSTRLIKCHWNTNFRNNSGLSQKGYTQNN